MFSTAADLKNRIAAQLPPDSRLREALEESAGLHRHLCPRQVLGVRLGFAGAESLGLAVPRRDKKLLVIVESDGCFVSGIQTTTGVGINYRTLRVLDYGKVAATFVHVESGAAVRVAPQLDVRERVWRYAPEGEHRRYFVMLLGYQVMPAEELLTIQPVRLQVPVKDLISRPGIRVNCARCGEEIINAREVLDGGEATCIPCAQGSYYQRTAVE